MNIQQAAERSGLTADTIRFYERVRILPAPARRANGYRDYAEEHLLTLRLARGLRDIDLPLPAVADILRVWHDGSCDALRSGLIETLEGALAETTARVEALQHARDCLGAILDGLRRMRPRDTRVQGMAPCSCTRLVVGARP